MFEPIEKKITDFEHIQSMTAEELFEFLCDISLDQGVCPCKGVCGQYDSCEACFMDWLNAEHIG
jgi:hypothetical protein